MSKFAPPAPEESVAVNVVPLVDIMFLLLLFLMVGGDMSHRESTEVQLPQADKAVEANRDVGDERYAVINVHPVKDPKDDSDRQAQWFREIANWQFAIGGVEYRDYWSLLDGQGEQMPGLKVIAAQKLEETPLPGTNPPKYLSAVKITIRADKSSPYGMIQQAMQACAEAGLYKIEVGAAKPATN
jgi:biopolymer transport protein ExbD